MFKKLVFMSRSSFQFVGLYHKTIEVRKCFKTVLSCVVYQLALFFETV